MLHKLTITFFFLIALFPTTYASATNNLTLGANKKLVEQYVAQYLLTEIYAQLGVTLRVLPLPPARAKQANLEKIIDGEIARIAPYGDDKPQLTIVTPSYYYLESAAYCLKTNTLKVNTARDLKGYKLATIRGVAHSDQATQQLANVYHVNTARQLFELLLRNRVEVIIDTEINGRRLLQDKRYNGVIRNCGTFAKFHLYNYLNDNHQSLHSKISQKIIELKSTGRLKQMTKQAEEQALALPSRYF